METSYQGGAGAESHWLMRADVYSSSQLCIQWQLCWKLEILHDGTIYRTELANPTNEDFWFSGEPVVKHLPTLNCFQLNTKVQHVFVANQQVSGLIIQSVSLFLICVQKSS